MTRSTAFFVNGGAGRHICSIPAFEKYEAENPVDPVTGTANDDMQLFELVVNSVLN